MGRGWGRKRRQGIEKKKYTGKRIKKNPPAPKDGPRKNKNAQVPKDRRPLEGKTS